MSIVLDIFFAQRSGKVGKAKVIVEPAFNRFSHDDWMVYLMRLCNPILMEQAQIWKKQHRVTLSQDGCYASCDWCSSEWKTYDENLKARTYICRNPECISHELRPGGFVEVSP